MASDQWDGRPENPERDGWHWLKHPEDLRPCPVGWDALHFAWCGGGMHSPRGIIELGYTYLGPCHTPADLAARVEAERVAGQAIIREMIRLADMGFEEAITQPEENGNFAIYEKAKAFLEVGPTPAYDAAIQAARAEGLEAAVKIAQDDERTYRGYDGCNPALIVPRIIAALRALAQQGESK